MRVFVKNMRGEALDTCDKRKDRLLLKQNKAKILSYTPFTIQLFYATGEATHTHHLGIDLGAKHTGIAITSDDKVLAKGEIEFRQDVKGLLETRKTYRRSRRSRKTRYRRCRFKFRTKRYYDSKKQKWVKKKRTFTSSRLNGWLPPSLQSRVNNTFFWIDKFQTLLPNGRTHIEVGKFDVQKMINPAIQGKEYQEGETIGFYDVRYYVFARDNYTCQVCKKKNKILNTHHVVYKSHGGSDRASNFASVCTDCHTSENHKPGKILWKWMQEKKKFPSYKEPPFMNSLRKRVFDKYPDAHITYGSTTTPHRKMLGLEKSHHHDAIAITGIEVIKENPASMFYVKQFRKKKRSLHEATARKGRKVRNTSQKRNQKNTKGSNGFFLNDKVQVFGKTGFITGFTSGGTYIKDIHDQYITIPGRSYKQVGFKEITFIKHQNNWQFIPHLPPSGA